MVILRMNMNRPFTTVQVVPQSFWASAPHYLSQAQAGNLLLIGEAEDRRGGLLRIRSTGSFVTLTADQAWEGAPIPWPRPEDGVKEIVIGPVNRIVTWIPTDPRGPSGVSDASALASS